MKFTPEQKQEVIAQLVEKWADEMDIDSLMEYYIDGQELYLEGVSDKQLAEYMEENDIELEDLAEQQRRDEKNGLYPDLADIAN